MANRAQESDEGHLVEQAINGDGAAYGVLYERYLDAIYRFIYFRVGSGPEAEDLTEEVFVKAWEAIPDFTPDTEQSFSTWLYRIAHNLVIDYHRKRRPQSWTSEQLALEESKNPSVEDAAHQRQDAALVAQAVQRLNEVEQQVIILRFVEGLSHSEIAEIIGKSEGASRIIQHRALSNLRVYMTELHSQPDLRDE
ncbi:MAG TPA: sigma-70 family RNA polymerase sigma factor [Candidatus Sulfomarinibacteraceae bacterium]|nr:sigma-70 family RNA polymerase sigma factor [Candidatus Sulfomarinibacteraceae bacterium]